MNERRERARRNETNGNERINERKKEEAGTKQRKERKKKGGERNAYSIFARVGKALETFSSTIMTLYPVSSSPRSPHPSNL